MTRWQKRLTARWPYLVATALTLGLVLCSGCIGTPQPIQSSQLTPQSDAKLKTVAEKIDKIEQVVTQVQVTVSTQTANFQLDAQRAKVEQARNKDMARLGISILGMIMGLALIGFISPAIPSPALRATMLIVAICLICAPIGIVLLWPF